MAKFTCIIVPENGTPRQFEGDNQDTLLAEVYKEIIAIESGWCWLSLDGIWYQVSEPIQKFVLKGSNGAVLELSSGSPVYSADNRFFTLIRLKHPLVK